MKSLQIDETKARQLYPNASAEFKATLEDTFGKEFFAGKITDRVKTVKDALAYFGIISKDLGDLLNYTGDDKDVMAARRFTEASIYCRVLNEGWKPNWNDSNEAKWFLYMQANKSGFGFSFTYYVYWYTCTTAGSRLAFRTKELAEHAGRNIESVYNDFFTL